MRSGSREIVVVIVTVVLIKVSANTHNTCSKQAAVVCGRASYKVAGNSHLIVSVFHFKSSGACSAAGSLDLVVSVDDQFATVDLDVSAGLCQISVYREGVTVEVEGVTYEI